MVALVGPEAGHHASFRLSRRGHVIDFWVAADCYSVAFVVGEDYQDSRCRRVL